MSRTKKRTDWIETKWLQVGQKTNLKNTIQIDSVAMTASAAELNVVDGVTAGTATASKALVLDSSGNLDALTITDSIAAGGTIVMDGGDITALGRVTAGTLSIGGTDIDASAAELNVLDAVTAGTVAASKGVVVDANKSVTGFRDVTFTGDLTGGTYVMGGTELAATGAELNTLDGVVASVDYSGIESPAGTITVAVQLNDAAGSAMATRAAIPFYLSSSATGDNSATADLSLGAGTDGHIVEWVTNSSFLGVSESDGDLDVQIGQTGTTTLYLVAVLPNGLLDVSGTLTFA